MDFKKTSIKTNQNVCGTDFKMELETDIIVPDIKPDVIKVISVTSLPSIKEKYTQNGKITISGVINYRIMYEGENDEFSVRSIEYSSPFSQSFDLPGIEEGDNVIVIPYLLNVTSNIQNSRKINVKSQHKLNIMADKSTETDIITDLNENEFLPFKSEKLEITSNIISQKDTIELADSIDLNEDISEILHNKCTLNRNDVKIVNNKIILKGEFISKIVYLTTDNNIKVYTFKEEFSEVLDVLGVTPENDYKINFIVRECDLNLISNTEGTTITLKALIDVFTNIYETSNVSGIYDVYSPDYNITASYNDIGYLKLLKKDEQINTISDTLEISNGNISEILCADAIGIIKNKHSLESKINVEAVIRMNILYISEGNLNSIKKEIPVEFFFELDKATLSDLKIIPHLTLSDISTSIRGVNQIEYKLPVICEISLFEEKNKNLLTNLKVDTNNLIDKTKDPSIVVYIVKSGDSLWKIAKKFNTTVEEIMSLNNLTSNEIIPQKRLLITKRI